MPATPHATHDGYTKGCSVCRWDAMSLEQQERHRASAREAWRRRNPDEAARRDEILAGLSAEPCACGSRAVTAYVTDYERRQFVWRCGPCAKFARKSFRRPHLTPGAFVATKPLSNVR
jgi:hypothetical protein